MKVEFVPQGKNYRKKVSGRSGLNRWVIRTRGHFVHFLKPKPCKRRKGQYFPGELGRH